MKTVETIEKEIRTLKDKLQTVKGTETEVYTRIVGYYRSVRNWNKGKRDEYNHRTLFSQPDRPSVREAAGTAISTSTYTDRNPAAFLKQDTSVQPSSYIYFYRTTCPNCPPVKNWLEGFYMNGKTVNVDEKSGFELAGKYRIFVSPTVVFIDESGNELYRATSVDSLKSLFTEVLV